MDKFEQGIKQVVHTCMKINSSDKVVIVGDEVSKEIMDALENECKTVTGDVKSFVLEEFGERPMTSFPKEIEEVANESTAAFYTADSMLGERNTLRVPLIKCATQNNGRQAHMPNITRQIIEQGMNVDYEEIRKISRRVYNIVSKANEIKVKTERGTDLSVKIDPNLKWVIADGFPGEKSSRWTNLPDGEVWTCAKEVNGRAVVDGVLGDHMCKKYGSIERTPVIVDIVNSRVIRISCDNKDIENDLMEYIKQDENANRIGEFAIGTNIGLKRLIGVMLQDEKFPGVHFAFGHGYPESSGADWTSKAHCDAVILRPTIIVGGREIMKEGKFLI